MTAEATRVPALQPGNVPPELRALRQWVVWKEVVRGGEVAKPPFRALNHSREASVDDASTWASFDEAVACWTGNPSVVSGIGFVFTAGDPYFGVDVDSLSKIERNRPLDPAQRERRETWVTGLLGHVRTYTERSPSGQGWHLICRGRLPAAGGRFPWGVEIYGSGRFFTITGCVVDNKFEITEQQEIADVLGGEVARRRQAGDAPSDDGELRRLDLSDEGAAAEACRAEPALGPRLAGEGAAPGSWSEAFYGAAAALDRVCGSPAQVLRVLLASPLVRAAQPSRTGESREAKAGRIFADVLARARAQNTPLLYHAREGRRTWERMREARQAEVAAAVKRAERAMAGLSRNAEALYGAFPRMPRELTRPPGLVGEFVEATEAACHLPYTKFAVPATLATLSGIVGRGYKLPDGSGLNCCFLLTAPSGTGKTQTMAAWEKFCGAAAAGLPATPSGPQRARIVSTSTSSIQAMMEDFQDQPACAWFNEECGAQLKAMSESKTNVDAALRDSFNRLYDCSNHHKRFSAPKSVALRKAAQVPIPNLNVSTYWTTVPTKFNLALDDVLDGFLSRVVVVRHEGRAGEAVKVVRELPAHLGARLRELMGCATNLDNLYASNRAEAEQLWAVDCSAVDVQYDGLVAACEAIKNRALDGELPAAYGTAGRLPATALRIAATLAVVEAPYAPRVAAEHLTWAFGYVLRCSVELLSDVERGSVGDQLDDALAMARVLRAMMTDKKYRGPHGVERRALHNRLRMVKPFKESREPSQAVTKFLRHAVEEQLVVAIEVAGYRGPPVTYLSPNQESPLWSN